MSTEKEVFGANIFPNPFNTSIKITFEKDLGKEVSVSIFDIKGSLIYTKNTVQFNEMIDLSKLSEGTYLFKLKAIESNNTVYFKIIKQ